LHSSIILGCFKNWKTREEHLSSYSYFYWSPSQCYWTHWEFCVYETSILFCFQHKTSMENISNHQFYETFQSEELNN
jgi:hypothetical protein